MANRTDELSPPEQLFLRLGMLQHMSELTLAAVIARAPADMREWLQNYLRTFDGIVPSDGAPQDAHGQLVAEFYRKIFREYANRVAAHIDGLIE